MSTIHSFLNVLVRVCRFMLRRLSGLWPAWPILLLGSAQLAGCFGQWIEPAPDPDARAYIAVYPGEKQPTQAADFYWLVVSVGKRRASQPIYQKDPPIPFWLEKGAMGQANVELFAVKGYCVIGRGAGSVEISDPVRYNLRVELSAIASPLCISSITVSGNGVVQSSALAEDCRSPKTCLIFEPDAKGGVIELKASAADPEWMLKDFEGCPSPQLPNCQLSASKTSTIVANFQHRGCAPDTWCDLSAISEGIDLHGVAGDNMGNTWAVGKAGTVLRIANNVGSKVGLDAGIVTQDLRALWVDRAGQRVLAGGGDELVLSYDGAKDKMVKRGAAEVGAVKSILSLGGSRFLAAGLTGGVSESLDGGGLWKLIAKHGDDELSGWSSSADVAYLAGGDNTVRKKGPMDAGWTALGTQRAVSLRGIGGSADGSTLWIAGGDGTLERWNGTAWAPMMTPTPKVPLNGIWVDAAANNVWAVGNNLTVWHWSPNLTTQISTKKLEASCKSPPCNLNAVWGSDKKIWVVGDDGIVAYYQLP